MEAVTDVARHFVGDSATSVREALQLMFATEGPLAMCKNSLRHFRFYSLCVLVSTVPQLEAETRVLAARFGQRPPVVTRLLCTAYNQLVHSSHESFVMRH